MYGVNEAFGCRETNPQSNFDKEPVTGLVDWTAPGLYITCLRLLSDPGYPAWNVSCVHGTLDGKKVKVNVPFDQLPKKGMKRELFKHEKASGVFIKGLFDNISTMN